MPWAFFRNLFSKRSRVTEPGRSRNYLIFFIHARIGPETVLSEVPIENTSDMWLSPLR
jgi:hypothetical protein